AEDGIRDPLVTGVQTCALPIFHQGKGRKDRLVPLSQRLLDELRSYWRQERPRPWLFPGQQAGTHLSIGQAQRLGQQVLRRSGLRSEERRVGEGGRAREWGGDAW